MDDERLETLQRELDLIKQRNARVEADKAWETSYFRIGIICLITYLVAASLLFVLGNNAFWLDALVPPVGFFLSTQSLIILKRWWIRTQYKPIETHKTESSTPTMN